MSNATLTLEKETARPPEITRLPNQKRGRVVVVIVMAMALLATALARSWGVNQRAVAMSHSRTVPLSGADKGNNSTSLSAMPSYATALLLGGLRGPLAMVLWTSSENQKMDNDLQDIDTKIEWIRLLQPEFDTVHLFQIWNKAYNLSVKMSSLNNKYITILDAIDYAQKVSRERPDDLNIICAVGSIYGDKLGQRAEQAYYRRRVRRETQTFKQVTFPNTRTDEFRKLAGSLGWNEDDSPIIHDVPNSRVLLEQTLANDLEKVFIGPDVVITPDSRHAEQEDEISWRRLRLDPILDVNGNVYPDLVQPKYASRGKSPGLDKQFYDGSEYQFLKQYQPYPYGLSPFALAYNYFSAAQELQDDWNEHPVQMGESVVDSRPGIYLEAWAQDEWERGRIAEMQMWGILQPNGTYADVDSPTATVQPDRAVVSEVSRQAALYGFDFSARLWGDARQEFLRHLNEYAAGVSGFQSHVDDCKANQNLMLADANYIRSQLVPAEQKQKCLDDAIAQYNLAMKTYAQIVLKYYVAQEVMDKAYPMDANGQKYNKETVELMDPAVTLKTYYDVVKTSEATYKDSLTGRYSRERDPYSDDRLRYNRFIVRCLDRLSSLGVH